MDGRTVAPLARGTFRATITGVGRLGPIEERLGRRLVRIVRPDSKEGQTLVRTRQVMFIGPEGIALGRVDLTQVRRLLALRLMSVLSESEETESSEALRDGLVRLRRGDLPAGRA
jgi:hypothetical protein